MVFLNNKNIKITSVLFILFLIISSCRQVVIKIESLPENTPEGAVIYIAGNFNFWDPSDANYQLTRNKDNSYTIQLPKAYGDIEYKFTRGDWSTVEKDKCGLEIENRLLHKPEADTIVHTIYSWADMEPIGCDSITIVITDIPPNTPKNEAIKIAGNFNSWNPDADSNYTARLNQLTGELSVTIPRDSGLSIEDIYYKIVRGDLSKPEADEYGKPLDKRKIPMLAKEGKVYIRIDNWEDIAVKRLNTVTIVLTEIPKNTPKSSPIYLVGNFNNWVPGDKNYLFKKNENKQYSITIPRGEYALLFKITRGGWETESANKWGRKLENYDFNYDDIDTVFLKVENWLDLVEDKKKEQTIIISKIPENTPQNATLYLASNYNDWDSKNKDFALKKTKDGTYRLTILKGMDEFEFRITRGDWSTEEVDKNGEKINSRKLKYWQDGNVYVEVEKWKDL